MTADLNFISFLIALVITSALVIGLGILSLSFGVLDFVFGRPKFAILKSENGEDDGFAFSFRFNAEKTKARPNKIKVQLFNPFGNPPEAHTYGIFAVQTKDFAEDVSLGPTFNKIKNANLGKNARILIEIADELGHSFQYEMKAKRFFTELARATESVSEYREGRGDTPSSSPLYVEVERNFISAPLPANTKKALVLPTNPEFAAQFTGSGGGASQGMGGQVAVEEVQENFAVSKVWIAPGCIVCDACETIYPEVFHVTAETCIVREDYPKDNGLRVEEAAEACPVEVIKFERA